MRLWKFIPVVYKIFVWSRMYCIPNHKCQSFKLDYSLRCSFSNTYYGLNNFKSFYDVKANIWQLDYCTALYMELLLKISQKLHLRSDMGSDRNDSGCPYNTSVLQAAVFFWMWFNMPVIMYTAYRTQSLVTWLCLLWYL